MCVWNFSELIMKSSSFFFHVENEKKKKCCILVSLLFDRAQFLLLAMEKSVASMKLHSLPFLI